MDKPLEYLDGLRHVRRVDQHLHLIADRSLLDPALDLLTEQSLKALMLLKPELIGQTVHQGDFTQWEFTECGGLQEVRFDPWGNEEFSGFIHPRPYLDLIVPRLELVLQ